MAVIYSDSKEVEEVGIKVLSEFAYPEEPNVKFLLTTAERSQWLGKCTRVSPKMKYLTGFDYVIEVWNVFWDSADEKAKNALMYHELNHIDCYEKRDGTLVWGMKKHDVEEFIEVAKRFGAWDAALKSLINNVKETGNVS